MKNKVCQTLSLFLTVMMLYAAPFGPAAEAETVDVTALCKARDTEEAWSAAEARSIDLNTAEDEIVRITEAGDYVLSGTLDGQVLIEAPEDAKVRLILNGVSIVSPEGPAIYERQADKLIITLAEGTENSLTDGSPVTDEDDTVGAALYAEDDLSINGQGTLAVNGTQKHGIQSKADLIIAGGAITVTAVTDGVRGRNSVLVLDGALGITCGGDGITATRTDAEGKGWIVLAGGTVQIRTGDGAGEVQVSSRGRGGFGGWGGRDDWGVFSGSADSAVSRKAVKAAASLTVLGGTYTLDCADDGLHAVNVTVEGGTFSIRSGDDAMHADQALTVSAGTIDITQSYEGLEAQNVTIAGGFIRIVSSDDGINASGGADGSGFGGRGRNGNNSASGSTGMMSISGGRIEVTVGGDGLDSNGSIQISGGVIGVWAATTTGEGAIDFNGSGTVSGGTLIVASTGCVMQDTAGLNGQSIMVFSASDSAGETIVLRDQYGTELGSFTPGQAFDTLMISSAQLAEGDLCTVTVGEKTLYSGQVTNSLSGAEGGNGFGSGRNNRRKSW